MTLLDMVACKGCIDALTHADLLGIIADCVSRLPHGDATDMPCLNLGSHAEAYAAVVALYEAGGEVGILRPTFVSTQRGCMWIEASRPKTGGAT